MLVSSVDRAFRKFQRSGDAPALAFVFDATASELTRLARYLAGPEASADDLLQATYLSAIEARQRFDPAERVLPWLIGILVHHARAARRRSRRELDPQRIRKDLGVDPSDEASASELSRTLDIAISRLPEAQRTVLRLYLQHGLEPVEIARSLERPPGTVRAQLSRGLKHLRRLLPRSLVTSQAWALVSTARLAEIRATVLGKCGGASVPVAGSTLLLGALAMSFNKKVLLAGGVLLAVLLSLVFRGGPAPERAANPDAAAELALVQAAATETAAASPSAQGSRTEVPLPEDVIATQPVHAAATGSLSVHVRTVRGLPAPDVGVAVESDLGVEHVRQPEFTRTNAEGDVVFDALSPNSYKVMTDVGMMALVDVIAGERAELTIPLTGGADVTGVVVDERGGPVPGAIVVRCLYDRAESIRVAETNSRGEFRLVQCWGPLVQARKHGFAPSKACPLPDNGTGRGEVRLVLGAEACEVSGRVVGVENGPLDGVLVTFHPEAANTRPVDAKAVQLRAIGVRTAPDGTFHCDEVPRGPVIVTAMSSDLELAPTSERIEVGVAPIHLGMRLGKGATIEGTISEGGVPLTSCSVSVVCLKSESPMSYLFFPVAVRFTSSDAEGRYQLRGVVPGEVDVRVTHNGREVLGRQTMTVQQGETALWNLDSGAVPRVSVGIEIEPAVPPGIHPVWHLTLSGGKPDNPTSISHTMDSSGKFLFDHLVEGHYTAVVSFDYSNDELVFPEYLPMLKREFDTSDQRITLRIPAELLRLQPARGRLVDAASNPVSGGLLRLRTDVFPGTARLQTTSRSKGGFAFPGLAAGRYTLEQIDSDRFVVLREFTVAGDRAEDLGDITIH